MPLFIAAMNIILEIWNQPRCPISICHHPDVNPGKYITKIWHINTTDYPTAARNDKIMKFAATWLALEDYHVE